VDTNLYEHGTCLDELAVQLVSFPGYTGSWEWGYSTEYLLLWLRSWTETRKWTAVASSERRWYRRQQVTCMGKIQRAKLN